MKLFYNQDDSSILFFDEAKVKKRPIVYPLGHLLLTFTDLDLEEITKLIINGFDISPIKSDDDYLNKRAKAGDTYDTLVQLHPYFRDYEILFEQTFAFVNDDFRPEDINHYGYQYKINKKAEKEEVKTFALPSKYSSANSEYHNYKIKNTNEGTSALKNMNKAWKLANNMSDSKIMERFKDIIISDFIVAFQESKKAIDFIFNPNDIYPELNNLSSRQKLYILQNFMAQSMPEKLPLKPGQHLITGTNYDDYFLGVENRSIDVLINIVKDIVPFEVEVMSGDPLSLCLYELNILAMNDARIKVCENCGKPFFILSNHETIYCNRYFGDARKTCKEIGPLLKQRKKRQNDPISRIYWKSYSRMRSKKNKNTITNEVFEVWKKYATELRDQAIRQLITIDNLEEELGIKNDDKILTEIINNLE